MEADRFEKNGQMVQETLKHLTLHLLSRVSLYREMITNKKWKVTSSEIQVAEKTILEYLKKLHRALQKHPQAEDLMSHIYPNIDGSINNYWLLKLADERKTKKST